MNTNILLPCHVLETFDDALVETFFSNIAKQMWHSKANLFLGFDTWVDDLWTLICRGSWSPRNLSLIHVDATPGKCYSSSVSKRKKAEFLPRKTHVHHKSEMWSTHWYYFDIVKKIIRCFRDIPKQLKSHPNERRSTREAMSRATTLD